MKRTHTGSTGSWAHAFDYARLAGLTTGATQRYASSMIRLASYSLAWGTT